MRQPIDALYDLSEDKDCKSEFSRLLKRYKNKDWFIYSGHMCQFTSNNRIKVLKFFLNQSKDDFYTMNPYISIIGENAFIPQAEKIDTLDLVLVSHIENVDFFLPFKNLRVLIANNLDDFPSTTCLAHLQKLRYMEVKSMSSVDLVKPPNLRLIVKDAFVL